VLQVLLQVALGVTGFEIVKESLFRNLTLWESHLATICASALASGAAAYYLLYRRHMVDEVAIEQELAQERNLLRALIDSTPDHIYAKDHDNRFLVVNAALARWMGQASAEEVLGKSDFDFYPRELAEQRTRDGEELMRSGRVSVSREERTEDSQGKVIWHLATEAPFRDASGKVVGLVGTSRDITERKLAEESLARERNLLRTLVDHLPDFIYVKDTQRRFLLANKSLAKLFGVASSEELLGKTVFDFCPPELAQAFDESDQAILRTGEPLINFEDTVFDPTGKTEWVLTTLVPLRDGHGNIVGFVGIDRDITERKQSEKKLEAATKAAEAASRAKSEFLANMSHEIRTPMNGILGMTGLLLETDLSFEQREYLEMVKQSADSLLTVINDILDFSKIEAGKLDLDLVEFDLRDSLEETIRTLALRADQKGLELLCEVRPEVPEVVWGDPTRLRQVIVNLVGNAIKFTERGEVVLTVELEREESGAHILQFTVSDTGIGIPTEKQNLIFEAFSQADSSTTRKYGGTGLGLTISSRLVQLMGGQIWLESTVGKGTQFHFRVPLQVGKRTTTPLSGAVEKLKGLTALIVDDNHANRRILEGVLASWGLRTVASRSGEEALARLAEAREAGETFTLVLTDVNMPEMDGFDLVERIRQNQELGTVTIMMLTSSGQRGDAARCRELGISAYLTKPIRPSELREAIVRLLAVPNRESYSLPLTRHSIREAPRLATVRLRVLLAEDNAVNQRLAIRLIEKQGHQVVVVNDGLEALEVLEHENFDLVLMDVQMPRMDGLEATAAIRRREKERGGHMSIVAMTAHAMKGDRERCLAAGMDGYLAKPLRVQELYELFGSYVSA